MVAAWTVARHIDFLGRELTLRTAVRGAPSNILMVIDREAPLHLIESQNIAWVWSESPRSRDEVIPRRPVRAGKRHLCLCCQASVSSPSV